MPSFLHLCSQIHANIFLFMRSKSFLGCFIYARTFTLLFLLPSSWICAHIALFMLIHLHIEFLVCAFGSVLLFLYSWSWIWAIIADCMLLLLLCTFPIRAFGSVMSFLWICSWICAISSLLVLWRNLRCCFPTSALWSTLFRSLSMLLSRFAAFCIHTLNFMQGFLWSHFLGHPVADTYICILSSIIIEKFMCIVRDNWYLLRFSCIGQPVSCDNSSWPSMPSLRE